MSEPANGAAPDRRIRRLVGVYDADGTTRGELTYWIGARLGRAHCALCDITHGLARERVDWKVCRASLPVPFDTYHRDDQPDPVRVAAQDRAPAILADTDDGLVALLSRQDLEACAGSPERLIESLYRAIDREGLLWPTR